MATTRKFKSAKNNQAINAFLDVVVGAVRTGSNQAMQKIAQRGIDTLVRHVASFGDYTGEMINSYQAAILKNGNLPKGGGAFTTSGELRGTTTYERQFRGPKGDIKLITSYGKTTNPISYKSVDRKGRSVAFRNDPKRNVNPDVAQSIRMPRHKHYQGFGRDITAIRSYNPTMKIGYEVVFNNPTPYAQHVMENNRGSHVMPIGGSMVLLNRGTLVTITDSELMKAIQRAKRMRK